MRTAGRCSAPEDAPLRIFSNACGFPAGVEQTVIALFSHEYRLAHAQITPPASTVAAVQGVTKAEHPPLSPGACPTSMRK